MIMDLTMKNCNAIMTSTILFQFNSREITTQFENKIILKVGLAWLTA